MGELALDPLGQLVNASGDLVLDDGGAPVVLPPNSGAVTIAADTWTVEGHRLARSVIARTGDDPAAALTAALASVVADHPDNRDVMIVAQAGTRYDDIIAVMDITRAAGLPSASLLGADGGN